MISERAPVYRGTPYVLDENYKTELRRRDRKITRPFFTNERNFGYVITSDIELKRLEKYIKALNPTVRCFDTETRNEDSDSIRGARMVGFSLSFGEEKWQNFYIPCGHTILEPYGRQISIDKLLQFIAKVLMVEGVTLGAHNMSYDMHILANHDLHIMKYVRKLKIGLYDTMVGSWMVDENQFKALKEQAKRRLKHKPYVGQLMTYSETVATVPNDVKRKHGLKANQKASINLVRVDIAGDYAINDSRAVLDLIPIYEVEMLKQDPLHERFHYFEMEYFHEAYKMERRGTKLNMPLLRRYKREIVRHIRRLEKELFQTVGYSFSTRSVPALTKLLYDELGFPVEHMTDPTKNKSNTSNPSTGKDALKTMLDYRRTQLEPMQEQIKKLEKNKRLKPIESKKLKRLKREADTLEQKLKIVKLISDVRLLHHLDSNFISGLLSKQVNGIIYPRFNQSGTVTGRLSSSEPNGQNMPNDVKDDDPRHAYSIRDLFIARKGYTLLVADFGNLELRILAHIAKDPALITAFMNGDDPHSSTAINMNTTHRLVKLGINPKELKNLAGTDKALLTFNDAKKNTYDLDGMFEKEAWTKDLFETYMYQGVDNSIDTLRKKMGDKETFKLLLRLQKEAKDLRAEGKLLNFAIIYGFGDDAIAQALNLRTTEEGKRKKTAYFKAYKGVYDWVQKIRREAEKVGFVETLLHKRRRKPSALQASNAPIQGTAGDIVKMAQVKLGNNPALRRMGFHQLLQIHDEIVSEVKTEFVEKAKFWMQKIMEHPLYEDLIVPLTAVPESGMTWNQCK